jgi:hypothetical protein
MWFIGVRCGNICNSNKKKKDDDEEELQLRNENNENISMKTTPKNVILDRISIVIGLAMTGIVLASSIEMFISADFSGDHVWCGSS